MWLQIDVSNFKNNNAHVGSVMLLNKVYILDNTFIKLLMCVEETLCTLSLAAKLISICLISRLNHSFREQNVCLEKYE